MCSKSKLIKCLKSNSLTYSQPPSYKYNYKMRTEIFPHHKYLNLYFQVYIYLIGSKQVRIFIFNNFIMIVFFFFWSFVVCSSYSGKDIYKKNEQISEWSRVEQLHLSFKLIFLLLRTNDSDTVQGYLWNFVTRELV